MTEAVTFALAAGALAAVNPCGFVMLPAYITLFVAGNADQANGRDAMGNLARAVTATLAMTSGFLFVFGLFGLALGPVASQLQRWLPVATVVIGAVLVVLGVFMLAGSGITVNLPKLSAGLDPMAGLRSMFLYGVSYAVASLGCTIGPFLVVTATTFSSGDWTSGVAAYAAYAAGMGLVVGVLAVAAALAQGSAARLLRRLLPHAERIGGLLLVAAGGYVAWYGIYELRVYAGGSATDPVVDAAGQVQVTLAQWVDRLGPLPLVLVLFALVAGAVTVSRSRRRATRP